MAGAFDQSMAYKSVGDVHFDDGREYALLDYVQSLPSLPRDPAAVLAAIDEFGRTEAYLMNVGAQKGQIVTDVIRERRPTLAVEMGGYVGYSAVMFAGAMRDAAAAEGGAEEVKYYSLERDPRFADVVRGVVELAGLEDVVEVITGPSTESLRRLHADGVLLGQVDLFFLDHYKPAYLTDLKLAEELGLVCEGTVVCADNVVKPGNPPYLAYVRAPVEEKVRAYRRQVEKDEEEDAEEEGEVVRDGEFPDPIRYQYIRSVGEEKLDGRVRGNPWLEYESVLMRSWDPSGIPDGVEVTRCLGEVLDEDERTAIWEWEGRE